MEHETNLHSQYDTDFGCNYDPTFIAEQQRALDEAAAIVRDRADTRQPQQEDDGPSTPPIRPNVVYGYDQPPSSVSRQQSPEQQRALEEAAAQVRDRTDTRQPQQEDDRPTTQPVRPNVVYGYDQPPSSGSRQQFPVTASNFNVVMNQPASTTILVTPQLQYYYDLSLFTCLCCCMPLGLIALIMSLKAASVADDGFYERARSYAKISKYLNLTGIIIGIISVVTVVVLYHSYFRSNNYNYHD